MGHPYIELFKDRVPPADYAERAKETIFPEDESTTPVPVGQIYHDFLENWESAWDKWSGKRLTVKGVVTFTGLDIHNTHSIELSDKADGDCYVLIVLPNEEAYCGVQVGDTIVARGNLLTTHEEYGVCLKKGEVVK